MLSKIFGRIFAVIGFLTVVLIALTIFSSVYFKKSVERIPEKALLTINLNNLTITEAPSQKDWQVLFTGAPTSLFSITHAIDHAATDPRIKGISMRVELLSLGQAQIQELRDAILRFRKCGKFAAFYTLTFGELSPGTSLYYLATAFDQIWIQPSGFLNITGLFAELPFAAKALENIGIKVKIGAREEYKTAVSFLTDKEMSPANAEQTQGLLKALFKEILKGITTERELHEETVLKTMEESPLMTAEKAVKLGLIDGMNYCDAYESLIQSRFGQGTNRYSIVKYIDYLAAEEKTTLHEKDEIALIYGTGMIQNGKEFKAFSDKFLTSDSMQKAFEAAIKNPKVKAIIFRIDSPGGSAVVSDSIARYIQIAQNHKLPVIASMGNVAASGGYWIAARCNKIIAQPMTITGSIGVFAGKALLGEMFQKLDINFGTIAEGPNGSFWSFLQDYTDQQWSFLQGTLDDIYKLFIQRVVEGRKLSLDHVKQIAKGRVWTGTQAKQYGLVDELGGIDKAIEVAKKEAKIPPEQEVKIVVYPQPKSFLEKLKNYYDEDAIETMSLAQALYQILSKIAVLIKSQTEPNPVLAPVPDKID